MSKSFYPIMFLSVLLLFSAVSNAQKIAPELEEKIASLKYNDMLDIIVWLNEPVGWQQRRAEIMSMPAGDERQKETAVALKKFYYRQAEPVLQVIDNLENEGKVVFKRHLWGAFSIAISADRNAIRKIAEHPDVRKIILDEPVERRFMVPYDINNPFEYAAWKERHSPDVPDVLFAPMAYAWQITKIDADDAWAAGYDGDGVLVAVFDTGVDYTHPDLSGHMWHNPADPIDGVDNDGNGFVDDYYGADFYDDDGDPMDNPSTVHHGTMCAGMIVGDGTSGTSTGSAPGATLMAIRVGDGSSFASGSDEVAAFQYALDHGADVGSMSYGSYPNNSVKDYYRYVMNNTFGTAGIVICVAAGNGDGSGGHYAVPYDISTPADIPPPWYRRSDSSPPGPVIAVGATTTGDAWASWASYGPTQWDYTGYYGSWHDYPSSDRLMKPDVAAPGEFIRTTTYGGGYAWEDGTSFSCPLTAGAVAVMLSKNSSLTPLEIDSILEMTAKDISPTGRDNQTGAGRIDLDSALYFVSGKAIVMDSVRIDDTALMIALEPMGDGDRNIDPGESANFIIYLRNSATQSAPDVQLTVTSVTNPNVTIVDNHSNYGTISPGATVFNVSDPVRMSVSASALYTEYCKCYVTITDGEGYTKPDSFAFRVGIYPFEFAYHDTLAPLLIGHWNCGYYQQMAWNWPSDSSNLLYSGEVMMGRGVDYVANAGMDFYPMDSLHLYYSPSTTISDAEGFSQFLDSTNTYWVKQYTYQWRTSPDDGFLMVFEKVKNFSAASLSGLITGAFFDFDIPPYDTNYANYDASNQWVYMYHSTSGPYVGIVALDGFLRGSVIDNPTYVYQDGMGWTDTVKWRFLDGTYSQTSGTSANDWSVILAFGPFNISAGDEVSYAFAVVAGDNLSDFQNNANQAKTQYATYSASLEVSDKNIPRDIIMFGAYPNPFNISTQISFAVVNGGDYSLEIFDVAGKLIRHWNFENCTSGVKTVLWNGEDLCGKVQSSGLYFVRLRGKKETFSKKLFLVK
ncbi:S8 family peptidase [bacterium]|nr:S8 family peptidase [bacterium]